ncbi:MAG TPA: DUF192 domain-containing protein [Tepidisphaeraceae bacterium]|jgi:hypothetical protein|nr:DUF192 domain-containing protein [Tepidisphaeraceae bacterium]
MMKLLSSVALLVLAALLGGCQQSPAALPVVSMKIGNQTFHLEVAATPESQETGLMKRDGMPEHHGMIFVFPQDEVRNFWMKNTRFPLDIVFLNSGGVVVSIRQMIAYDESLTSSDSPARYAIELNKGAAAAAGLKVGDTLAIPEPAKLK